ncbi:3-hydroxyacyl-ACP dehydratase FabZ family protein [Streptomyces sp. NPDC018045]|uniref:3-hydroxyacyl-ACP dehydratase FabZ family protein n=1 Tax=Streptomyces sp. NPDC018045 TaxID=3365037 RepID=UPI0037BA524B
MTSVGLPATAAARGAALPWNALDEVRCLPGLTVRATKVVRHRDPYLSGHFPGFPLYPGTFVLEAVRQAVHALVRHHWGPAARTVLSAVRSARFTAPLPAGDTLRLSATGTLHADAPDLLRIDARCRRRDGRQSAALRLDFCLRSPPGPRPAAPCSHPGGAEPRGTVLAYRDLMDVLPHRHPALLVDRVVALGPGRRLTAEKTVDRGEPCYAGLDGRTAPDGFAYPPSLLFESFGQAGAVLWLRSGAPDDRARGVPVLGHLRACTFHRPVFPGETVRHEVCVEHARGAAVTLSGTSRVDGRRVLSVGFALAVVRPVSVLTGGRRTVAALPPPDDPRETP